MSEPARHHLDEFMLHEYLDDALDLRVRAEVEAHLTTCPECAARLAELQALFAAIEALPDVPLQRDLTPEVLETLRPAPVTASPLLRWTTALQLAAAIALLLFAWPRITDRLAGLVAGALGAQVVAGLTDGVRLLSAQWSAALVWARDLDVPGVGAARLAPVLQLPPLTWWLLLAAALLFWLAGNGLLLRWFGEETNGG